MKKYNLIVVLFLFYSIYSVTQAQPILYGLTASGPAGTGSISKYDGTAGTLVSVYGFPDNGTSPQNNDPVQATDNKLYGMLTGGGLYGKGVIYSYDIPTSSYSKLYDFDVTNGSSPNGNLVQATNGKLYGMTPAGGMNNTGVIFSFDIVTHSYSKLYDFNISDGANPKGSLFQASDGKLYGMTYVGGLYGYGVIFSLDIATDSYTKLYDFFVQSDGRHPTGNFIQASNGKLYALASAGGSSSGGVLFSYDITSYTYTKLFDFYGANGELSYFFNPENHYVNNNALVQAANGKLYGTTEFGGTSPSGPFGVVFSYDISTAVYSKIHDFDYNFGATPNGRLVKAPNGKLYGTTWDGGLNAYGVIYSIEPSGNSFTKILDLYNADFTAGISNLSLAADGKLYGSSWFGGTAVDLGHLYSFDPSANIYAEGYSFKKDNGLAPLSALTRATDGNLYGVTFAGGDNSGGVLFSYNHTTSSYNKLFDFDNNQSPNIHGSYPYSGTIQANDGKLYGTTSGGGALTYGIIYSYDIGTSSFSNLYDFDNVNGGGPRGLLIQATDGKLYGMTYGGGSIGAGVIFSYDISSSTYTKVYDFDASTADGYNPEGSLIQASNGKLYGMTRFGGSNGAGVIFSFDILTSTFSKLFDFSPANGTNPEGSLIQASNGKLYGLTRTGGTVNRGVLFSFDPSVNTYAKLFEFNIALNRQPLGSLMQASDGKLYGMTRIGSTGGNHGAIFSYDINTATYTSLMNFNGTNGAVLPGFDVQLTEVFNATISCRTDTTVTTGLDQCNISINNLDPVFSPTGTTASVNYTLSGATTGSGTGSVSGMQFNTGVTTVTYTITGVPSQTCSFMVTVNSYTLLATNSIKLQQNNTVVNGSVGVVNATGSASIKKNVSIAGPGAFLKAQNISLQAPYTIPTIIYAPAIAPLPLMQYNTTSTSGLSNATVPNNTTTTITGDRKNVTIGTNCIVTLTGSIFGAITIGSGSTAIFTQSSINVTAITLNTGTVSANTQLKFSGDVIVRCAGSILVNTRSIVNPDNHKVVIYLGKTSGSPVSFIVATGGNETVNASLYIPSGKISVGGHATNMTYMNGKFIAENIETLDKNVIWNWYDCSESESLLITSKTTNANLEQAGKPITGFNIKAWPNPSNHQFTLNIESNSNEPVSIRVFDMYGRRVYSATGTANRQYEFGKNLVSGAYVAEVRQGNNRFAEKLIKQ